MSILENIRSGQDSTGMQIIAVLAMVSFIFLYATPQGDRTQVVVEVNGTKIMETDFSRVYQQALSQLEAQRGSSLPNSETQSLRETVRESMVSSMVERQEADRIGLTVSSVEVRGELQKITLFQNQNGIFDLEIYDRYLKRIQLSRDAFKIRLRDDLLNQKMRALITMGTTMSAPMYEKTFKQSQTRINLTYVRVAPMLFLDDIETKDADVFQWAETREGEIKEAYQDEFDQLYNHPEQLQVSMIRLAAIDDGIGIADLLPRMHTIREEIDAGADFGTLAGKYSEDNTAENGGDMGLRPVPQMALAVVDAVRDLEVGDLSRIVTTDTDVRLYKLAGKQEAVIDPLESVRGVIAKRLYRAEHAPAVALSFAEDTLLSPWKSSNEVPEDALKTRGMNAIPTGMIPVFGTGSLLGPPESLLQAAQVANVGDVLPEVYESRGDYWVAQLTTREEADMAAFEANEDAITEQILADYRDVVYQLWLRDAVARSDIN